jgi:hypothetical protein
MKMKDRKKTKKGGDLSTIQAAEMKEILGVKFTGA